MQGEVALAIKISMCGVIQKMQIKFPVTADSRVHHSNTHVKCEDARRRGDMKKEMGGKGWEVEGRQGVTAHPSTVWLCPSCRMFPSMGVYTQFSELWNNHEREDRVWMGSSRTIKLCRNIVFILFYCPQLCTHDLVPIGRHVTTAGDTCVGPAVTSQCPARLLSTVVAPYIVRVEFICDMVQWARSQKPVCQFHFTKLAQAAEQKT